VGEAPPIGLKAIPGVLITAAVTGAIVHFALWLDRPIALVFGALIALTDPLPSSHASGPLARHDGSR
jgi:NhaP-type Na+/H+ or K+/H+ antiporter